MTGYPYIESLRAFAHRLIDPASARMAVAPEWPKWGYWFGGGNMASGSGRPL